MAAENIKGEQIQNNHKRTEEWVEQNQNENSWGRGNKNRRVSNRIENEEGHRSFSYLEDFHEN